MNDIEKFKLPKPEIEADIYYLTEKEGGRKTPVHNGYRGQFYYNGYNWDAPQQFIDKDICNPGDSVKVYLQTVSTEAHVGQLYVGQTFETREGDRIVGKGRITKLLRPDFNYWDGSTFLQSLDPTIKPYSDEELIGFKKDVDILLTRTGIIKNVQCSMTSQADSIILVTCNAKSGTDSRLILDTVINCWKTKLSTTNHLYKVQFKPRFDSAKNISVIDKVVLTFATWHSNYITGQIIVTEENKLWWKFWQN